MYGSQREKRIFEFSFAEKIQPPVSGRAVADTQQGEFFQLINETLFGTFCTFGNGGHSSNIRAVEGDEFVGFPMLGNFKDKSAGVADGHVQFSDGVSGLVRTGGASCFSVGNTLVVLPVVTALLSCFRVVISQLVVF